jgi:hypothetical protein
MHPEARRTDQAEEAARVAAAGGAAARVAAEGGVSDRGDAAVGDAAGALDAATLGADTQVGLGLCCSPHPRLPLNSSSEVSELRRLRHGESVYLALIRGERLGRRHSQRTRGDERAAQSDARGGEARALGLVP